MSSDPIKRALLLIKKDEWEAAHAIVQDIESRSAAHIHAYLHRLEGDKWNADYWYRRAGEPSCSASLELELADLVRRYASEE